jgi:hypothetical protein
MIPMIDVVCEAACLTAAQVGAALPGLQEQVTSDFSPHWGQNAVLTLQPFVRPGNWGLAILDDSDQAGALGYHDLTSDGLPMGKVFAKSDLQYGSSWTVTVSHELLEMLADPYCNTCAQGPDGFYAYEVCDAVEDDSLGYQSGGIQVSDFVLPSWFCSGALGPYDFKNQATQPLQLLPGGYISKFSPSSGWTQITAQQACTLGEACRSMRQGSRRSARQRGSLLRRSEGRAH